MTEWNALAVATKIGCHLPVVETDIGSPLLFESPPPLGKAILSSFAKHHSSQRNGLRLRAASHAVRGISASRLIVIETHAGDGRCELDRDADHLIRFVADFERAHYERKAALIPLPPLAPNDPLMQILKKEGLNPVRRLGKGGHAECILCDDTKWGRVVAKRFKSAKQFWQEQNIYSLIGRQKFSPYLLRSIPKSKMLVLSHALGHRLADVKRCDVAQWLKPIVATLNAACSHFGKLPAPVIHRDIKPQNLILAQDGPKLIDYSSAEIADVERDCGRGEPPRRSKLGAGAYSFKAFEQLIGSHKQTGKVDVFGSAATIFWCLYGVPPYRNLATDLPTALRFYKRRHSLVEKCLRKDFPRFGSALAKCLEVNPEEREGTLDVVLNLLAKAVEDPRILIGLDVVQ
jgi:hypothetical protein